MKYIVKHPDDLILLSEQLLSKHYQATIFAFYGQMGIGKTTFIKAICKQLKIASIVVSPTFTIINEYKRINGSLVYHCDFYRLKSISEALSIGIEEYLYSGNYCFLEWPELVKPILPENVVDVNLYEDNNIRYITF